MCDDESRREVDTIRVVMVNKDGLDAASASIGDKLANLRPGAFVAIDTEFSGLGQDRDVSHDNLQTRYAAIRRIANTRGIYSVGIAIFNPSHAINSSNSDGNSMGEGTAAITVKPDYDVATYDLLTLCQSTFEVSANSGDFLVKHGFDFNRLFREGIPYSRASTTPDERNAPNTEPTTTPQPSSAPECLPWRWGKLPRGLLWRIGHYNVPIVVHNGLFDLIFLYAAFQGPLPESLNQFVSVLLDCVPAGFWDTKVIATSNFHRNSFLAYLFAKSVLGSAIHVHSAGNLPAADVTNPTEPKFSKAPDTLCALFSFKGFCPRGTTCPFSHDAFRVVEEEQNGLAAKDSSEAYKRHRAQSKSWKRLKDESKSSSSKKSRKMRKKLQHTAAASAQADTTCVETPTAKVEAIPTHTEVIDMINEAATAVEALSNAQQVSKSIRDVTTAICTMEPVTTDTDGIVGNVSEVTASKSKDKDINGSSAMELVDKAENSVAEEVADILNDNIDSSSRTAHSAGWDAFCTGYTFGTYRATLTAESLEKHHNYIALSKKFSDLLLRRSEYADLDDTSKQLATTAVPKPEAPESCCIPLQ